MLTALPAVQTLEDTAVVAAGGGALLSMVTDPVNPDIHVAFVAQDGVTLRVILDSERQVAEVSALPSLAVAA